MKRRTRQRPEIREFILRNIKNYPQEIASRTAKEFGVSRTTANNYVRQLIKNGIIIGEGKTNARHYKICYLVDEVFQLRVTVHLEEDVIWRHKILPLIKDVKQNIIDICQHGFTEMLNNVVDHSTSYNVIISYRQTYNRITINITDQGIGIFNKIQQSFKLPDPRSALLELSKGKLTSYPAKHSGEGVFFTSRMFDEFFILSDTLFYRRTRQNDADWLIESKDQKASEKGTHIGMSISLDATWTTREVFERYENDGIGFRKTHVPINLSKYPGEQLVSRSQAKRILSRFNDFSEVMLDFKGVQTIGQAFADEIFRVFKNEHPAITIYAVNTTPEIDDMIHHVQKAALSMAAKSPLT